MVHIMLMRMRMKQTLGTNLTTILHQKQNLNPNLVHKGEEKSPSEKKPEGQHIKMLQVSLKKIEQIH